VSIAYRLRGFTNLSFTEEEMRDMRYESYLDSPADFVQFEVLTEQTKELAALAQN
jgi:hypothetical protein